MTKGLVCDTIYTNKTSEMKNLFVFLTLTIFLSVCHAQTMDTVSTDTALVVTPRSDISVFGIYRLESETGTPLMWFTQENGRYFLEARANFDWANTATVAIGKTMSFGNYWATPKVGILLAMSSSGYDGVTLEANHGISFGDFSVFQMNQISVGLRNANPTFFYDYSEISYSPIKNVSFVYGAQFFRALETQEGEESLEWWIDHGPAVKISFKGGFYMKPWLTWDPNHDNQKVIVGVGRSF